MQAIPEASSARKCPEQRQATLDHLLEAEKFAEAQFGLPTSAQSAAAGDTRISLSAWHKAYGGAESIALRSELLRAELDKRLAEGELPSIDPSNALFTGAHTDLMQKAVYGFIFPWFRWKS